jgi:methylmalonyl-CoA mutase N-terminal domain/subunit
MREAGCDAIQEVAFTLANGIEYVKTAVASGLDV